MTNIQGRVANEGVVCGREGDERDLGAEGGLGGGEGGHGAGRPAVARVEAGGDVKDVEHLGREMGAGSEEPEDDTEDGGG